MTEGNMKKMNNIGCCRVWWLMGRVLMALLLSLPLSSAAQTNDDLILENQYEFKLCDGNPNGQTLVVYNNSVHPEFANGTFYVNWGDGTETEPWGDENSKSHRYEKWGEFQLVFSWRSVDQSKSLEQTYSVIRLAQPSAALVVENAGVCKGANSKIEIIKYEDQDKSTQYVLNMGGEETLTLSQEEVKKDGGIVEHVFETEDCPIIITLSVTNACAEFMAPVVSTVQMALFVKPEVDFTIPDLNCAGHPLVIKNETKGGKDLLCNDNTYYVWQFEGQSVAFFEKEPTVVYDSPGEYEVMLIANTGQSECSADTLRDTITITPTPQINFSVNFDTICSGEIIEFSNLSKGQATLPDGKPTFTYSWDKVWDPIIGAIPNKNYEYVEGGKNDPDSKIRFYGHGAYHVTLRAENIQCQCVCDEECNKERSKDTIIVVRESPVVDTLDLDSIICPDDTGFKILDFSKDNLVQYEWNGNAQGGVTWIIQNKGEEGSVEYMDGTDQTSIYPKVKLKEGATYIFQVKVEPVSVNNNFCTQPSEKTKEVKIPNTTIQSKFVPAPGNGPLKFCSGDRVEIANESEGENITYSWDYEVKGDHKGLTLEVPLLDKKTFSAVFDYGVYKVTGTMSVSGQCPVKINGGDQVEYEIQIGKRPEIGNVRMPIDSALCAGESIEFTKNLIEYKFYDSENKVNWTFSPELPADAYQKGNVSSPCPKIKFSKPNQTYTYTIEMPEDWVNGCEEPGKKYQHQGTIIVHNDKLDRVIKREVISDTVCSEEVLTLENVAQDGTQPDLSTSIVTYEWHAINAQNEITDSCEIVGQNTSKVQIKFLNIGKYGIVSNVTDDHCGAKDSDTMWFVVCKIPEITFEPNPRIGTPGIIEMKDWVKIDWLYNNSNQELQWEVTKEAMTISPIAGSSSKFQMNSPGDYIVSMTIPYTQCSQSGVTETANIHIIDTTIKNTESIQPNSQEFCVGEKLTFVNEAFAERELEWFWEVQDAKSGYAFEDTGGLTSKQKNPTIIFSASGEYTVHLMINEGVNKKELFFKLMVYGLPDLKLDNIERCETSFFGGDEIKSKINLDNNELLGAQWSVTPQGNGEWHFQDGDYQDFYPTFAFEPDENTSYCNYIVSVNYRTHCREHSQATFQVHVDEQVKITPLEDEYVCIWSEAKELIAVPDTGVWSVKDHTLSDNIYNRNDIFYFNPVFSTNENRDVELIYSVKNGFCISEEVKTIHVHALPVVDAGNDLQMCLNDKPLRLIGRDSIEGGHWVENQGKWKWENIVWDDYHFDIQKLPSSPSSEPYKLVYEYTYPYNHSLSCSNTDTIELFVRALPKTHFDISAPIVLGDTLCINKKVRFIPEDTLGNTFEWYFNWLQEPALKEVSNESSILHAYANHGDYGVKCVASRLYKNTISDLVCYDTSEIKTVTVLREPPSVYFDVNQTANCAPLQITISVDKNAYSLDYADFTYTWDFGNGERSESQKLIDKVSQTYQSAIRDTTYKISWEVSNRCKADKYEKDITVYSIPQVGLTLKKSWECAPVEVEINNTTTGDKCEFIWTISNNQNLDTIRNLPATRDLKYFFDKVETTTLYHINLRAKNRCAEADTVIELVIKPQTIKADFTVLDESVACVREELFFRNNSTDTVAYIKKTLWNFGDGFISNKWEERHVYDNAGTYDVVLTIDNGCGWAADTQQVRIDPLPKLTIICQDTLCEHDEFDFSFEKDVKLNFYEWKLQDTLIQRDRFKYIFDGYGEFPVTLVGTADRVTGCQDSVTKTVVVNNKPVMTILPLDTMVCSPLNYIPFVEGEYETLLWDYGDGSELTSASEHYYENRSDSAFQYIVKAFVTTNKGCNSEYSRRVTVYNTPVALLDKVVEGGRPQRVTFQNLSEGANAGHWILPLQGEVYSVDNQTEEFLENGTYPVTLIASNRYGCADTITLSHEVSLHGLYFPNTFIPHSLNEKISRFNGVGMGLRSYRLEILDQYGNVLWVTEELQDGKPVGGWDGTNRKGERMPQGVYIWRAKAIYGNDDVWTGDNNDSGIPEYTQGTVLLLRE